MIAAPPIDCSSRACVYRDTADPQALYVDLLEPAPVHGESAVRWMPIPDSSAYLVGEVRFGPGAEGFGEVPRVSPGQRMIPMPWETVPVFAWNRQGDGVRILGRGKTSGFGASNA